MTLVSDVLHPPLLMTSSSHDTGISAVSFSKITKLMQPSSYGVDVYSQWNSHVCNLFLLRFLLVSSVHVMISRRHTISNTLSLFLDNYSQSMFHRYACLVFSVREDAEGYGDSWGHSRHGDSYTCEDAQGYGDSYTSTFVDTPNSSYFHMLLRLCIAPATSPVHLFTYCCSDVASSLMSPPKYTNSSTWLRSQH